MVPGTSKGSFPGHAGRLAFICDGSTKTESDEVCVADSDGSHLGFITWSYNQFETTPMWSADGRRLTFIADHFGTGGGNLGNVAVINADRTNLRVLTHDHTDSNPAWFPDGRTIVFGRATRYVEGVPVGSGELVAINADGTNLRILRAVGSTDGIGQPAWSPDGRTIAYEAQYVNPFGGSVEGVYEMDANGSNERLVIPGFAEWPTWSPDGSKLAYFFTDGSYAHDIWIANADGTGQTRVTHVGDALPFKLAWSPDGGRLAFTRDDGNAQAAVYTIAVDGTDLRRVAIADTIGSPNSSQPDWQPCPGTCPPAPGKQVKPPSNEETVVLTVGPGNKISVTLHGRKVKRVSPYKRVSFLLRDRSRHDNAHLRGGHLNVRTGIRFVGKLTVPAQTLRLGNYRFYSDAHPRRLRAHFDVCC